MENKKIYTDDEVQILGLDSNPQKSSPRNKKKIILFSLLALALVTTVIVLIFRNKKETGNAYSNQAGSTPTQQINDSTDQPLKHSYIEVLEETVNDVPLFVYVPHNAHAELALGIPDRADSSIIFATQAADVGGDNFKIVGDYVLAGEQLARGQRKDGFCAIIDHKITIGFGTDHPFLQQSIQQKGYFFRQYPLVKNSTVIGNKPKGKSIRRALAIRNGQVIMVESRSRESFYDFAQALADIGISDAIYLAGGSAFGWYYNQNGERTVFGKEEEMFPNPNYLIWKSN